MTGPRPFEIFLACNPGLEAVLADEVRHKGFKRPAAVPGGVTILGLWPDVWRANLWLRGANRVLARIDSFRVTQLAELYARARHVDWPSILPPGVPFEVEAVCAKSRIYHSGAAAERITQAIRSRVGSAHGADSPVTIMARLDHDVCTLSIDTTGELLHKRGYKTAIGHAPMRETLAALFLQQCGYDGTEPMLDPMCGSGTFVIEAAQIAARLNPGRLRRFAFEALATFDPASWQQMRGVARAADASVRCYGSDRDDAAVAMSIANAERAGVAAGTSFRCATVSECTPPDGTPGLVIMNPPYGARMGETERLTALYRALGQTLLQRFTGWRVGLITTDR